MEIFKKKKSWVCFKQHTIHIYSGYILLFEEIFYLVTLVIILMMPQIETAAGYVEEHLTDFLNGVRNPDHMKVEQLRINTFGTWPQGRKNWPSELANAGFYYIPEKDETKCFVCGITIKGSEWQNSQDVLLKHKTANPLCPYAQGTYQNHVPFQTREQREQNKPYLHQKPGRSLRDFIRSGDNGVYESDHPRTGQSTAAPTSGSNRDSLVVDGGAGGQGQSQSSSGRTDGRCKGHLFNYL